MENVPELNELLDLPNFPDASHLAASVITGRQVVLYGAGEWALSYFQRIAPLSPVFLPHAVLDRRFQEPGMFHGIPAFHPDNYRATPNELALIFVGNFSAHPEIIRSLHTAGFERIIVGTDIYEAHVCTRNRQLDEAGMGFFAERKPEILRAYSRLSDDLSREIFTRHLAVHILRKHIPIPCRQLDEQYFSADFPRQADYRNTISCGAEKGTTVREMIARGFRMDNLFLFEPDPANYAELIKTTRAVGLAGTNVICLPIAAYSSDCILRFNAGMGATSKVGTGDDFVTAGRIDSIVKCPATFLNMDIEGAEPAALIGARETIGNYAPELAISVYHDPAHIFEILNWIADNFAHYRNFYFRNYTGFTNETVLYCVV